MSVTFTAELVAPAGYVIACCKAAAEKAPRFGTYDDAVAALQDFELLHMVNEIELRPSLDGCDVPDICPEYPWQVLPVHDDPAPRVNVHQSNAAALLRTLGYADACGLVDLHGDAEASDFAARVVLALAMAPVDAGMPGYDDTRPGEARWIVGGRSCGYLQATLGELGELARWCAERGRAVQWA